MAKLDPHDLARFLIGRLPDAQGTDVETLARTLALSQRLGQLRVWCDAEGEVTGLVAWLRLGAMGIGEAMAQRFSPRLRVNAVLNKDTGPWLFITELATPPQISGYRIVRALVKQEKPDYVAGRVGGKFRIRKVRHG